MGLPGIASVTLYCSPAHPRQWIVYSSRLGWLIFPARANGWMERRAYLDVDPTSLNHVPTWMAFGTGLLEAILARAA